MKHVSSFLLLGLSFIFITGCHNPSASDLPRPAEQLAGEPAKYFFEAGEEVYDTTHSIDTKGYWENGDIITEFDCPDALRFFPPIRLRFWNCVPAVNGRLPSYRETVNGSSIHTYGGKDNPKVKAFNGMWLPKLAYFGHAPVKMITDPANPRRQISVPQPVVVIQMVETGKDTLVGFRYLTGGCGGSSFRHFHFLTDADARNLAAYAD